jgi:DNA-binding NtrC family response regulator
MLLISEDPALIESVDQVIRPIGGLSLRVLPAIEGTAVLESWDGVALILLHLTRRGPAPEVAGLLQLISKGRRSIATLVVAEHQDPDQALTLLRLGVADYLDWPLDLHRLAYLIEVLTVRGRRAGSIPVAEGSLTPSQDRDDPVLDDETPEDDPLMEQVRRVAPQDATILLSGETGTGKSRLARLIHELSHRRAEPFLAINCGSLPAGTIENEMFGHVRGAFPGAGSDRRGKFAEVGRGTLFLDEIDALPMADQAKLLRAVEDRAFEPVGSTRSMPVRARLIVASSRPLEEEVEAQRFRSDLYYRLNVVGFQLPPLRERRHAILPLASRFLAEFAARDGRKVAAISDEALRMLEAHDWPGNIRELRNLIERAVSVCSGDTIRPEDLPDAVLRAGARPKANRGPLAVPAVSLPAMARSTLAQIKRDAELARITEALEKHGNNRLRAACELGISRMTLYKKLYKYGLMQPQAASRGGVA